MKKLLLLLMTLCLYISISVGFAAEYPQENYEMYYEGNRNYPIAFVQWGNGYVLDGYSLRLKGSEANELAVDIHEVDLATNRMKPNPMHVYAKFDQDRASFVIGFMDSPNAKPQQLLSFDESYLNKGTSETALLFPAGRALWEMYTGTPLYKQYPMLKPIGESGAPCMIRVNENTRYARLDYDRAQVQMEKTSGLEEYYITFKPNHFVISSISAEDPQIEARLRREELNKVMYYEANPRVRLVANYMGIVR